MRLPARSTKQVAGLLMERYGSISSRSPCRQASFWRQTLCRSATPPALPHSLLLLLVLATPPHLWTQSRSQQLNSKLQYSAVRCLCTCGWSFRTVENPEFKAFIQKLRPNYELPSADTLAGTLLNCVAASVRLQNAQWLQDDATAYHLTLTPE
ncbi:TPA: hypothetical protein ACH3X1_014259 [Trebouxia sp. C0004]